MDIQSEVADIMEDKTYSAQKLLHNLFEACRDELEILIHQNMHEDLCGGASNPGLCNEMDPYDGQLLHSYLLNSRFTGEDF